MVYRKLSKIHPYLRPRVGVQANIVLGSPKKNCEGIGICRIERAAVSKPMPTSRKCCQAKALIIRKEGRLIFYFIKHSLSPCVVKKQFQNGQFKLTESILIPDDIGHELGLPAQSSLTTGYYDVIDLGTHLSIAISIGSVKHLAMSLN